MAAKKSSPKGGGFTLFSLPLLLRARDKFLLKINLSPFQLMDLLGSRLTEGRTMLRISLMAATALLISACAGIAHDTPEAKQQMKQDLHLAPIIDSSRMN
jgi:hypothetical protein